jgi:hypothetical protein
MIRRTTWIILGLFVLLLVFAWYLQHTKANAALQATATPGNQNLLDIAENNIASITIEDDQGNKVSLGRDDNDLWSLTEPKVDATDVGGAESIVSQLVSLSVMSTLDPVPPPEATGLDKPADTITIQLKDGSETKIQVGKQTPIANGYYVQVDQGAVSVVSKFGIESVLKMLTEPPIQVTPTETGTPETATPQAGIPGSETPEATTSATATPIPTIAGPELTPPVTDTPVPSQTPAQ